jgi:hypothetical protein
MHRFQLPGQADHLLILDDSGSIWDSTDLSSAILTVSGMTDFSLAVLYGRAYISPHNGLRGLAGEEVYVYTGSGIARLAAGAGPTSITLTATQGATGGNVYKGVHVIAVAYEYSSGYISPPAGYIAYTAADDTHKIEIGGIPSKPTNVVAVHVLASAAIDSEIWTGDFDAAKMYFIPEARLIANESTYTANFFDTQLIDDAEYLRDQRTTIPAGVGIAAFRSRLYVWGTNESQATVLVSEAGEPESFDQYLGIVDVYPEDPDGAVKNIAEHRSGLLYATKSHRTYSITPSSLAPSTWEVNLIDAGEGSEAFGIGVIVDYPGASAESFLIASRSGLHLFDGRFGANGILSDVISDIWERIPSAYFHLMQIIVDPYNSEFFICLPLDAATANSHILYGNYANGVDPESIRWSLWSSAAFTNPASILMRQDYTTKEYEILVGTSTGIYQLDLSLILDHAEPIVSYAQTAHLGASGVTHFGAVRYRIVGSGVLDCFAYGLDNSPNQTLQGFTLSSTPGKDIVRWVNLVSEKGSFKFSVDAANEWFELYRLDIFGKSLWQTRNT